MVIDNPDMSTVPPPVSAPVVLNDNVPKAPPAEKMAPVPEVRISPDRMSVAVRTDQDINSANAWGIIHKEIGGGWATNPEVEGWTPLYPAQT